MKRNWYAIAILVLLAAGVAGPVGLVCAALVVLLALAQVSALGVPYCAPVRFPQTALSPDGVTRRTYLAETEVSQWSKPDRSVPPCRSAF